MRGQHDQVGNSCTDMFYTMRQVFAVPQFASQAGNPFTFSTCTPNEIRNFLTDMCYDMRCRPPGATTCTGTLAFDGTTCGNGKWCQDGLCVSSAQAPNTPTGQ
ncbi:hypothetical protein BaRGS_00034855 [Batillaria attramentaria]|uniref:ADAMTS cysteine-rich domain-containing protein n=1 Tax=Batillaria attramentaria TaxID=370345 RepID=A0ABD0JGW2_9CAEN